MPPPTDSKTPRSCWLRARQPAQKAERRDAILETAAAMFDEVGYETISLNGIGRRVGLAKSNIYRYFQSKEGIFLALLQDGHDRWLGDAVGRLVALPSPTTPERVGRTLADSLAAAPRLCALASIVSSVLEHNVDAERIAQHKTAYVAGAMRLAMALGVALPTLDPGLHPGRAFRFLKQAYALVTGLWPAAHPPPAAAEVLRRPAFAAMRVDFAEDLADGLTLVLRGLSLGDGAATAESPEPGRPS